MLLCIDMGQGIFVLLIERATYPEKPNQIQFPKANPPIPKTKPNPIFLHKNQTIQLSESRIQHPKNPKPLIKPSKGFRHKNPVFSPGFSFYQSIPFVVGSASCIGSFFTAIRMAFAKALKMASILWCSLSPWQKTLRLHLAASENDLKK